MTTATHRPAVPGAVLALAAGVVAVGLLLDAAAQWQALFVEVAGLGFCGAGYAAWHRRGQRDTGLLLGVAGVVLVVAGFAVAASRPAVTTQRMELLPGMVGLAVLVAGLLPVRTGWERALVTGGAALLFVGVVTSGVVRGASAFHLLAATVAVVLAWDLGDQAVSLGRQVGRQAATARATVVHAGGTAVAGACVVAVGLGVYRFDVQGLSLTAFAVLLVAGFLLSLSLRH